MRGIEMRGIEPRDHDLTVLARDYTEWVGHHMERRNNANGMTTEMARAVTPTWPDVFVALFTWSLALQTRTCSASISACIAGNRSPL